MKLIKKIIAFTSALTMAVSMGATALAAVDNPDAVNNDSNPINFSLEEVSHTATGMYTINLNYDNYVVNQGIASLTVKVAVSDPAAVSKASFTAVNAGGSPVTNYNTKDGNLVISNTDLTGLVIKDFTQASGTYYTLKLKMADGYYDTTTGDITKPLTIKVNYVVGQVGEQVYDPDFEEYSFDSLKLENICLNEPVYGGTVGVTTSGDLVYGGSPAPTVDWSTATKYGDYHSDIDSSDAVAYTAELTGDDTVEYNKVTWKVTPVEGAAKGCYADVNIGGTGTYTIGLVIGDVTSDQISKVEAALGEQGNNAQ